MASTDVPRRRGRPRTNHDARRNEIVDVAARLFAERGYHATSIGDLTEATGLHRGGLYHYIVSKENLLFLIHERFIEPLLEEARRIESRGDTPEETLRAVARALMTDIAQYHDQVTVFLHEWRTVSAAAADAERATKVREARAEFESIVLRILRAGSAQGDFAIEDARLPMLGFLGLINYSYQWYRSGADPDPETVADTFCDIFLNGVRTR